MSERKVIQDQRATENTMSNNRQSVLEHDYTVSFRDGKRVDATDVILKRLQKGLKTGTRHTVEYLRASRLACLIFEVKISSSYTNMLSSMSEKSWKIVICFAAIVLFISKNKSISNLLHHYLKLTQIQYVSFSTSLLYAYQTQPRNVVHFHHSRATSPHTCYLYRLI